MTATTTAPTIGERFEALRQEKKGGVSYRNIEREMLLRFGPRITPSHTAIERYHKGVTLERADTLVLLALCEYYDEPVNEVLPELDDARDSIRALVESSFGWIETGPFTPDPGGVTFIGKAA